MYTLEELKKESERLVSVPLRGYFFEIMWKELKFAIITISFRPLTGIFF
mgnify:CR=1 FL=1